MNESLTVNQSVIQRFLVVFRRLLLLAWSLNSRRLLRLVQDLNLLILDIGETLIYDTESPLVRKEFHPLA